jgi:hypothetical protein
MLAKEIVLTCGIHHHRRSGNLQDIGPAVRNGRFAAPVDTGGTKHAQDGYGDKKISHGAKILNLFLREKNRI